MNCHFETSRSRNTGFRIQKPDLFIGCVGVLLLGTPQRFKSGQLPSNEIPKSATVEIVLLSAPGIDDKGSQWEIAYEFRITNEAANEAAYFEARKQGKPEVRVGELIKEGDFKKTLRPPENHRFVFEIPFSLEIQQRLRNQPKERVKNTPGPVTPEANKRLQEQEIKFQVFKFYSVINIYDAKLKKNIIIPVPQEWDFANYPDARFGFTIEINDDGSYRWKTTLPANTRSPMMEIRRP
jgi:hypothetical protein